MKFITESGESITNNRGPRTEPWGTPQLTEEGEAVKRNTRDTKSL